MSPDGHFVSQTMDLQENIHRHHRHRKGEPDDTETQREMRGVCLPKDKRNPNPQPHNLGTTLK